MSTLGKWRRKINKFWKKKNAKDDIHNRAEKLLDEYELAIVGLASGITEQLNLLIERMLRNQGVPESIIEGAKNIIKIELDKSPKKVVKVLSDILERLL